MFMNRLCDPKRQNRSALLYAATLVAVAAAGCADGGAEDQLQGTGDELEQTDGPKVVSSDRDESPSANNSGTPAVTPVALATVRTHTQHIYSKLGVNNRRAAVRRGHQLNL